jgi:hypothetical protein
MKSAENIYAGVPAQTLTEADKVEIANMAAQKILENFTSNNARMKKK